MPERTGLGLKWALELSVAGALGGYSCNLAPLKDRPIRDYWRVEFPQLKEEAFTRAMDAFRALGERQFKQYAWLGRKIAGHYLDFTLRGLGID